MKLKILLYYIFFVGCNNPTAIEEHRLNKVNFDINLPLDRNGYYILVLDKTKNQTIHTIRGQIFPPIEYKRFEWESNLDFRVGPYPVSTTSLRSYTNKEGTFGNNIGPVLEMVGDTMKLTVRWDPTAEFDDMYFYEPTESKTFYIILE